MSSIVLRSDIDEFNVTAMVLRLPARGNWVALLTIGASTKPTVASAATIVVTQEDGTEDLFVGAVRATENVEGTDDLSVTIVGGADKLVDPAIPARHHTAGAQTIPAGVVAAGICAAAGEALAEGVEDALDAYPLAQWTRVAGPAGLATDLLAWALGLAWRVLPDGSLWMGVETWPEPTDEQAQRAEFYRARPADNTIVYSADGCPYFPGMTIDGVQAIEVCYHVDSNAGDGGRYLCEVRHAGPGDPVYSPDLTIYRSTYAGTVMAESTDGMLEVAADDVRIGDDLRNIPARTSWPGCSMTIPEGTRVRIAFESSSPAGCFAASSIDQDAGATSAFALVGDDIDCGYLTASGVAPGSPIIFALAPPGTDPPPLNSIHIVGKEVGPGHAYAKGRPG